MGNYTALPEFNAAVTEKGDCAELSAEAAAMRELCARFIRNAVQQYKARRQEYTASQVGEFERLIREQDDLVEQYQIMSSTGPRVRVNP